MNDTLTLAIVGHLVGDYLLQNDWMALNKKKPGLLGLMACWTHSAIWALSVCLFAGWSGWAEVLLMLAHFAQDRTNVIAWWMTRVNRQEKFLAPPCGPWSAIVVDNVWHIVTLFIVSKFVP